MLEYCDWGCLRDALDAGAFFSGGSLNYAAILDTAADVAKAMLHLHCNQVGKVAGERARSCRVMTVTLHLVCCAVRRWRDNNCGRDGSAAVRSFAA